MPRALLALLFSFSACFDDVPLDHAPCPCVEGWTCCAENYICVQDALDCPRPNAAEQIFVGKADILLVVDNSVSMRERQTLLSKAMPTFVRSLLEAKIHFRLGITSTDTAGSYEDCDGQPFATGPRGLGNCERRAVEVSDLHDGTLGRLMAAYDPEAFSLSEFAQLSTALQPRLELLFKDMPWVIDAGALQRDACWLCNCDTCNTGNTCFDTCALPTAATMGKSYAISNIAGLGTRGSGYEAGLQAALLSLGINPRELTDTSALNSPDSLVAPGAANRYLDESWHRPDAGLVILFVTDEEDCSAPAYLAEADVCFQYEEGSGYPTGSMCYQPDVQAQMLSVARMHDLLAQAHPLPCNRAVGFLGGAKLAGDLWVAADCSDSAENCSCVASGSVVDERWCQFTQDSSTDLVNPVCDALAGNRYVEFANLAPQRLLRNMCGDDGRFLEDAALLVIQNAGGACLTTD